MKSKKSYLDKRSQARSAVKLPIQYRVMNSDESPEEVRGKVALAKDLSLEGVSLKIIPDKAVKIGEIIRLDITLPEVSRHIFAYGEVIWVKRSEAGIHIMLVPEEGRKFLEAYLNPAEKRARSSYPSRIKSRSWTGKPIPISGAQPSG